MPKPVRMDALPPEIATGFCRMEVQKVFRKYHNKGDKGKGGSVSAWTCVRMFEVVIRLRDIAVIPRNPGHL